jgi:2-methylcitrate dehydratase
MLGGHKNDVINVLSHAFIDGQSLRTYRHSPNTGSRKSWAAGDATSRAVRLAWMVLQGEMGYPSALTAKTWGFYDVCFKNQALNMPKALGSYVMENILFKISFPAEFHAQTAVECAIALHPQIKNKLDHIEKIVITTHESAMRIINKTGPLHNPADRDHCLQYMTAAGLVFGNLKAEYYENDVANDPRIDALREKMIVEEDLQFSKDYLDPNKRSIANALQIYFNDGTKTEKITVEYPIGHQRRREEGIPYLLQKFENNMKTHFSDPKTHELRNMFQNLPELEAMPVNHFMELLIK